MDTEHLLRVARETIDKVKFCFAITLGETGDANARVVQPTALDEDWRVRFLTVRSSRKVRETERSGRLTLAYQYDPEAAYVTLLGRPNIIDDVAVKRAIWRDDTYRWYPNGPEDPNVVLVELITARIELWSLQRDVMPGLSAAVLDRSDRGWTQSTT